jgi:hypothetical protein
MVFGRSRLVWRPLDCYMSTTYLLLRFGLCLRMLTWDRMGPLGQSGGPSVDKSDLESWHLHNCSPRLCWLTYWSHAWDMGPVNQCSLLPIDAWLFPTVWMVVTGEKLGMHPWICQPMWCGSGQKPFFLRASGSVQCCWWLHERLPRMVTAHRKHTSGVYWRRKYV